MTEFIKGFFSSSKSKSHAQANDFSDFFDKKSGEKVKIIRQVLREANAEQKKLLREFKDRKISKK
jgi:hypothetical protein